MVVHTLIFSFGSDIGDGELSSFMQDMQSAMDAADAEAFQWRPHLRLPADDHAPVFIATAIAQVRFADLKTLEAAFNVPALGEAMGKWQKQHPYQVVWANHEPVL